MFTGLIEDVGTVCRIQRQSDSFRLTVQCGHLATEEIAIGDSIAVSGACLTVVMIDGRYFQADVSPETLERTTFGNAKPGDRVNIERALRLSDRIDGHLVTGHIDGQGQILHKERFGNATRVVIETPPSLSRYMITKGSVAVDGVSLTINSCDEKGFEVSIIPHTAKLTTKSLKKSGDPVNIETDMIGKYVERFLMQKENVNSEKENSTSPIDINFLRKTGFL